jgi:flagellar protein FlaG
VKIVNISSNEIVNQRSNTSNTVDKPVKVEEIRKEAVVEKKEPRVDMRELKASVDKANKVLFKNNTHLQFRIHEKTNEVMVKVIEDETGEVLREIPPEKMLDMVAKLWEIAGVFVNEKR